MIDKLLMRLRRFDTVSAAEEQALRSAASDVVCFDRYRTIVKAKEEQQFSNLLIEGIVHRYKDLQDGSRQSLELSVAGDFIDLHSLLMKRLDHNIGALTNCRLVLFPHDRLKALIGEWHHLGRLLWLSTMIDASIHREWIVSLGLRSAKARIAHLICEIKVRLETVALAEGLTYELPLTQEDFGELLGLTAVHVNRSLRELREQDVVTFNKKVVDIRDWERLTAIAEFDPFYLGLRQEPR
ncbi:Crp/Fnr family transcriptional regulator [Allosphingosinicella vermicomposti]|uniref:Crp/Fnr family transcriptional regulator n=1 Tax=Allosphingosinicella vermicomposti TaxID=614671 RepID=UPI000D0F8B5A|nr:Crp/Fnr family transcriptional regulator [Allosphingosinicella vermicomposti]